MLSFPLSAFSAIFSMLAGSFWMAAAYGRTVDPPWRDTKVVSEADLPAHQAKWNARAALCASVAAILQTFLFLVEKWSVVFP
jgi:hypothetical protein